MAQFARPDADLSTGGWNTPPLWSALDDNSDAEFVDETINFTSDSFDVSLSAVTDPGVSTGHILRIRTSDDSTTANFNLTLLQGAVSKAVLFFTSGVGFRTDTYTLTGAEADAITDYSNLSVQVLVENFGNGGTAAVAWVEFEVPDGGGAAPGANTPTQRSRGFNLQQIVAAEDEGRFNELDVRNWFCQGLMPV